jgi:1-acyl-sn-glycerol-3-phosphate acyltransferase
MAILPWFWTLILHLSNLLCLVRFRRLLQIHGQVPDGAAILCAKHSSGFDIPVLAWLTWRTRQSRAYFQMGSFVGYPVLGVLVPILKRLGGFPVMRPKEVLRLRHRGSKKEDVLRHMAEVNVGAERTREAVLRSGGTLVVFPEGTRDESRVRPLHSNLEIETALRLRKEGLRVWIWPVVLSYGPPRLFRRRLRVEAMEPFEPASEDAGVVLHRIQGIFEGCWVPPARGSVEGARAEKGRALT